MSHRLFIHQGNQMTFMPWNQAYSVGLENVDEQHRWLFDATNRLHNEVSKTVRSRLVIGDILEGLMDYTMNHFIMEEELFQRYSYPDAQAHKALHDKFTATIMGMVTNFENGANIENEMLEMLKHWLVQHIMQTDTAYIPFFREQGVLNFSGHSV